MQDPSNSNMNNAQKPPMTSFGNPTAAFRSANHRRAHSEVNFRGLPDDLDLGSDPFGGPPGSFDEIGSEDDLFSTYMDVEKLGSGSADGGDCRIDNAGGGGEPEEAGEGEKSVRPRHRYSNSVDGSVFLSEAIEAKKAMAPDKLAELWSIDPKRAKRTCNANPAILKCELLCLECHCVGMKLVLDESMSQCSLEACLGSSLTTHGRTLLALLGRSSGQRSTLMRKPVLFKDFLLVGASNLLLGNFPKESVAPRDRTSLVLSHLGFTQLAPFVNLTLTPLSTLDELARTRLEFSGSIQIRLMPVRSSPGKKILANRQSAARSKERKARYISELERKSSDPSNRSNHPVCTTHTVPDTTGLSNENTELKLRLQAMEQQAQLRDALNEALKQELDRLKVATGEMASPSDAYNFGMQHLPYTQSSFYSQQPQNGTSDAQQMQMPQFHPLQSNMLNHGQHQLLVASLSLSPSLRCCSRTPSDVCRASISTPEALIL
ncbi:Basic-leucine zipper (bZIP) transcription factor family protein [Actinidia rufa]|uniref:Basic-leucine zipper (BZIP) transcription factor family protein n=1 Tax=Actinidia rufa TaxID=165716 RepID=A0A7J0GWD0_9ERIC|nr:Basic-leucine zipper (bZIP) transcription factor family protein [Actinidia rufa]